MVLKSEDVVKVIKQEIPVMKPDAVDVAAKLIRALNSIHNTTIDANVKGLKVRQKYEKAIQLSADCSKKGVSHVLPTRGRKVRRGGSQSSEMVFAIEVLRQELHRSTGIVLDELMNQMENPSNNTDVKDLLAVHKQSFTNLHQSLKSSWIATDEMEGLVRQWKEEHTMGTTSNWIITGTASLLGAVIGSIASTVFGISLNYRDEPQLCDVSSLIKERDMSVIHRDGAESCPRCKHSIYSIGGNDAPTLFSHSIRSRASDVHHMGYEESPRSSEESLRFQSKFADRAATSLQSAYEASYLHYGATQKLKREQAAYLVRYTTGMSEKNF